jgi:adenosine deaminase
MDDDTTAHDEHYHFVEALPKVELHAHLNGCIRDTTLFELAKERGATLSEHLFSETPISAQDHSMYNVRPRSLQDCFAMFAEIPKCVNDLPALERITTEALEDFALHYVVYLELRSTPKVLLVSSSKNNKQSGTKEESADKKRYCETILRAMVEFELRENERYTQEVASGNAKSRLPMICRFIVAIDRSGSAEEALEHAELAIDLKRNHHDHQERVVGVDLGGNPTKVRAYIKQRRSDKYSY